LSSTTDNLTKSYIYYGRKKTIKYDVKFVKIQNNITKKKIKQHFSGIVKPRKEQEAPGHLETTQQIAKWRFLTTLGNHERRLAILFQYPFHPANKNHYLRYSIQMKTLIIYDFWSYGHNIMYDFYIVIK